MTAGGGLADRFVMLHVEAMTLPMSLLMIVAHAGSTMPAQDQPPALPTREQVAAALLLSETCRDPDGFTQCLPSYPVEARFSEFSCKLEPERRGTLTFATCRIAGEVRWTGLRPGQSPYWRPFEAYPFSLMRDGDGGRWRAAE